MRVPDNSNAIQSDNVGFQMLQKAGWKEGTGLGAASSGIVQPIDRLVFYYLVSDKTINLRNSYYTG